MNNAKSNCKLFLIPIGNLLSLTALILFGIQGLSISFIAMFCYHAVFSPRQALLADLTLFFTVMPAAPLVVFLHGVPLSVFMWNFPVVSIALTVMFLFKTRLASKFKLNHPL